MVSEHKSEMKVTGFSLPTSLIALLQEKANQQMNGNRSAMAKHYIILGMEAERRVPSQEAPDQEVHIAKEG